MGSNLSILTLSERCFVLFACFLRMKFKCNLVIDRSNLLDEDNDDSDHDNNTKNNQNLT